MRAVIGVYKSGEVWTDNAALGPEQARRFASALEIFGIVVDCTKAWTHWKTSGAFDLSTTDPVAIARAVRQALDVSSAFHIAGV
jgi:hypothetical protein